jgi:hypothetical protein
MPRRGLPDTAVVNSLAAMRRTDWLKHWADSIECLTA